MDCPVAWCDRGEHPADVEGHHALIISTGPPGTDHHEVAVYQSEYTPDGLVVLAALTARDEYTQSIWPGSSASDAAKLLTVAGLSHLAGGFLAALELLSRES